MKMKNRYLALCWSALCLALAAPAVLAQDYEPVPVSISRSQISMNGKQYYAHIVLERQTIYGITKAYNVTEEDLYAANPMLKQEGLRSGTVIYIPVVSEHKEKSATVKETPVKEKPAAKEKPVKEKAEKGGTGSGKESEPASEETREAPLDADIQEVLKKVDCSKIEFNEETGEVTLPEGMKIDFGGIAKGYASQSVAEILRENGITSAIMDLGGNIQAVGRKPNGSKWRIALNDRNKGGFLGILTVEDCAVITSGGYERNFRDAEGNVYHHIIDPKTGHPADNGFSVDASVTIVCGNGTMADALSTAMYVCGPEKAMEYWRAHRDEFQMIMMTDGNKMYVTEGIADDYQSDYKFEVIH